jgi:hypothetical protein
MGNDKHHRAHRARSNQAVLQAADAATAKDEFAAWIEHRPDRHSYPDRGDELRPTSWRPGRREKCPNQTAIFLARKQDVCPNFVRNALEARENFEFCQSTSPSASQVSDMRMAWSATSWPGP